jgi:hypothetical protein
MLRLRIVLAVAVLALGAGSIRAEDPCRSNCDDWLASCLSACNDAPVPLECRDNCRFADRQCLDACDGD